MWIPCSGRKVEKVARARKEAKVQEKAKRTMNVEKKNLASTAERKGTGRKIAGLPKQRATPRARKVERKAEKERKAKASMARILWKSKMRAPSTLLRWKSTTRAAVPPSWTSAPWSLRRIGSSSTSILVQQ